MSLLLFLFLPLVLCNRAVGTALGKRAGVSGTASVFLNESTGAPHQLASGILYGIPDQLDQIPDRFYTDIGFKYSRAGGAQLEGQGWIGSFDGYKTRFESALSNWKTTTKYGGTFILLPHDIWGADGTQPSDAVYPGDNGNWTNYDNFLDQLISDLRANGMVDGIVIDIWNEPDGSGFWNRNQSQYLDTWGRTYYRLRKDLPGSLISGPASAGTPLLDNTWWTTWATFVAENGSIPDQYSWHMEGGGGDMQSTVAGYKQILEDNGLATDHVLNINEYAVWDEEVPSGSAWWIAQLERVDAFGLRGNWLSGEALHDFMAGLVGKPNSTGDSYNYTAGGYWPTGAWQVYRYYTQDMTGNRLQTAPTSDLRGDVYAVVDNCAVRVLVGTRVATGTFSVSLNNLSSIGLPENGTAQIRTLQFSGSDDHYARVDGPTYLGLSTQTYSNNTLLLTVDQEDVYSAYAFELQL